MNVMVSTSVLVVILCSVGFTAVSAIKCFQCNSAVDPGCADLTVNDTKSIYYKECTGREGNVFFCRKITHTILNDDSDPRIYRQCGWLSDNKEDVCKKQDSDFILEMNCLCRSDGCNGSVTVISNLTILIAVLSLAVFINQLFY